MELETVEVMAKNLMERHGLDDWTFDFDRAKVRFGHCVYGTQTITLSKHLCKLNSKKEVKDTILHEIAHALVGKKHNHNRIWQAKLIELGGNGHRCYSRDDVETPKFNYVLVCPNCGHKHGYYRKPRMNKACGICCRKYNHGEYSSKFKMVIEGVK